MSQQHNSSITTRVELLELLRSEKLLRFLRNASAETLPLTDDALDQAAQFAVGQTVRIQLSAAPHPRILSVKAETASEQDKAAGDEHTEPDVDELFERWAGLLERLA